MQLSEVGVYAVNMSGFLTSSDVLMIFAFLWFAFTSISGKNYSMKRSVFLLIAIAFLAPGVVSLLPAQTLEADYQVQDTFNSSVGSIGPLTIVGPAGGVTFTSDTVNGNPQRVLNIQASNSIAPFDESGVQTQTNPFLSASNYSVVLLANFNLNTADVVATKIFYFKNLSSDAGLYVNAASGTLAFIDGSGVIQGVGGAALSSLTYAQIASHVIALPISPVSTSTAPLLFPSPTTSGWLFSAILPCREIHFSPCSKMMAWVWGDRY